MSKILLKSQSIKKALSTTFNYSMDSFDLGIDEQQIKSITHLHLDDFDGIEELNYFQNLQLLEFTKEQYNANSVIANSVILPYLPNLKKLIVSNMTGLETINVHNLDSLTDVSMINNANLKRIIGLEKLHSLNNLYLIDNELKDFSELKTLISNKADINIHLDIHYLPLFYDGKLKAEISSYLTLKWVESGAFTKDILIDFEKGSQLYDELVRLSEKFSLSKLADIRQLKDVYDWICNEYAFDTQLHIKRSITSSGNKIVQLKTDTHEFNSVFFLLQNHYAGIDGILNFISLLLRMNNINVKKVLCCIPNDYNRKFLFEKGYTTQSQCNHLILKVQANDGWVYLDPVIDSIYPDNSMRQFIQTKQDITKTYFLVDSEKDTIDAKLTQKIEKIDTSADDTKLIDEELPMETTLISYTTKSIYISKPDGSHKKVISSTPFTLGRQKDNDYVVDNSNVGRYHCRIIEINNTYFIEDLNSLNGTFVNQVRLLPNQKMVIRNNDMIEMANEIIIFVEK